MRRLAVDCCLNCMYIFISRISVSSCLGLPVYIFINRLNKNINITEVKVFTFHSSIFLKSIQEREALLFELILGVGLLIKIPPQILRLIRHNTISRGLTWNLLAELYRGGPLFIEIKRASIDLTKIVVVVNLYHVPLDLVLLRVYDRFHVV